MGNNSKFSFKETFFKGITELLVICLAILFFFILYKFSDIFHGIQKICSILMPIIVGVALAYLIAPVVNFFEKHLDRLAEQYSLFLKRISEKEKKNPFSEMNQKMTETVQDIQESLPLKMVKKEKKKFAFPSRLIAIIITLVLIGFMIYLLAYLVVPQIYYNVRRIMTALPWQLNNFMDQLILMVKGNAELENLVNTGYEQIQKFIGKWMQQDMVDQISVLLSRVFGVVSSVIDFVIGIIVAVYVLMSKEVFKRQFKKVVYAFCSDDIAQKLFTVLAESDRIFGGFITGKILDSFIIGIMCFAFASLVKFPYVALISVIIGVTNIIPVFGPYLGAIPCAFLILLADPRKGLMFIIFIIILQQIDGNIIGPSILGESTGLSPFWVVFSILLGGGLFGIVGMLIGVPTFGVIYYLFKSLVNYQLEKKGKQI